MMNGMFGSVIPPAGGRSIHVQTKEQTLENDIHRHSKLAKKELKAAGKAERKAMKVLSRLIDGRICINTLFHLGTHSLREGYAQGRHEQH